MQNPALARFLFILYIFLYFAKSICILFFIVQVAKYNKFTKKRLSQQDKFIRWSLKIMSVSYVTAFINYTYEFVLMVFMFYDLDSLADITNLASRIKFTLISVSGTLMAICLFYNLARWYLIIKQMNREKELLSQNFRLTIKFLTVILSIVGISQITILNINSI